MVAAIIMSGEVLSADGVSGRGARAGFEIQERIPKEDQR